MKQLLPFLLTLSVLAGACKATKKAYEQGDYERAVINSVDRLRSNPDHRKSQETLSLAYPAMLEYFQDKVIQSRQSANPLRWEGIMEYYDIMNRAHDEIQRSPAARRVIPNPQNFASEYQDARRNAAEARYLLGEDALGMAEDGDREAGKEAFTHFQKADALIPGYRDAYSLTQYARDLATLFVAIEPVPIHSQMLEMSNEYFQNQIIEYASSVNFGEFVYLYPAGRNERRPADQILRMSFDDFVVGQAYVKETVRERSRDSVIIDEVQVTQDSVRPIYGTVKAESHVFKKQVTSTGLLDVRVIDARSGRVISQRKFPGTHQWVDSWGFYTGDQRALNEDDKEAMRKKRESPVPAPQQLFIEFTRPIYGQVTNYLRDYYRRYR